MICTGPSVLEKISVSETWSHQGYRYSSSSPPTPPPPSPAKWIICPSQVIYSVVCKHSLRVWYPFILQGGEGYCKLRVIPKNTTQWPARSRTSQGKRVFHANRLIEIRRKRSFLPPKRETTLKTSRYQTGRHMNNKPNNLPKTLVSRCTHVKDVDLFSCSSFKSPSLSQKETLPLHCILTLSNQKLIPRNSFKLAKLFNQKKIKQRHTPAQFNTLVRNF